MKRTGLTAAFLAIIVGINIFLQVNLLEAGLDNQVVNDYAPISVDAYDYVNRARSLSG